MFGIDSDKINETAGKADALLQEGLDALEPAEIRKFVRSLNELLQEIRDGKVSVSIQLRRNP